MLFMLVQLYVHHSQIASGAPGTTRKTQEVSVQLRPTNTCLGPDHPGKRTLVLHSSPKL